jgi:hypothetical protein
MPYDERLIERQRGQAAADDAQSRRPLARVRGRVEAVETDAGGSRVKLDLGGGRSLSLPVGADEARRFAPGDEVELELLPAPPEHGAAPP